MSPPTSRLDRTIDQHIIHFHTAMLSERRLDGETVDLERVRKRFRVENGLAKYVGFKRVLALTNRALVDDLKKMGNGANLAMEQKLLHLHRKSYNNSTPSRLWKRLFGCLPAEILRNKVYSSPIAWINDGKKGILINNFVVVWPLLLASHVGGLETKKKRSGKKNSRQCS